MKHSSSIYQSIQHSHYYKNSVTHAESYPYKKMRPNLVGGTMWFFIKREKYDPKLRNM
jgi:hypothetical protein